MLNKVMTWLLIMSLLISQTYAYASVPCEANSDATSQLEHGMSNHMPSHMQHDMQQQESAMDCCDNQECSCPTGTYSSVTLTHFVTVSSLNVVSNPSGFYLFSIQDAFLPSLHKPPIIS